MKNIKNKKNIKLKKIKKYIKELNKMIKKEKNEEMKNLIISELIKNKKIKNNIIKKKNEKIFLEIERGVGGNESSIFISDLKEMYIKYIKKMKWKKRIISEVSNNMNGFKEIIILIKGKNIYNNLKYESGVHRVQRVPKTENKGRVHTSTCKVVVYKEKNIKKIKFKNEDLKIETFKSSGAGGQHVNKTNSAVRIKHIPTKIVVECQNERSQHKNKKYALKIIKTKVTNLILNKEKQKSNNKKKLLKGCGERSEKIRTYNYKNNKIIDHKFKIKLNLEEILEGNLNKLIKKIKKYEKKNKKNKKNK